MNYRILIHDTAVKELEETIEYYEKILPALSIRLLNDFNESLLFVQSRPRSFQIKVVHSDKLN